MDVFCASIPSDERLQGVGAHKPEREHPIRRVHYRARIEKIRRFRGNNAFLRRESNQTRFTLHQSHLDRSKMSLDRDFTEKKLDFRARHGEKAAAERDRAHLRGDRLRGGQISGKVF